MGQQVSVETFTSTADNDGHKYWASFEPFPFKSGQNKIAYLGILNGVGPLKGQKCVVKAFIEGYGTREDWVCETRKSRLAKKIATDYNAAVFDEDYKIIFNMPILAEIDQLSDCVCLSDMLGKPRKRMKETEFVSMEVYLRGDFEHFEYGMVPPEYLEATEAFSHYSWCRTEGNSLIANLQGIKTNRLYHCTGPVVHSKDRLYGQMDLGHSGIKSFFKLHKCNRICQNWPRLGDGVDLRGWGGFGGYNTANNQIIPSAPPPYEVTPNYIRTLYPQLPAYSEFPPANHSSYGQSGVMIDWRDCVMTQGVENYSFSPFGLHNFWRVQQLRYSFRQPCFDYAGGRSRSRRWSDCERLLPAEEEEDYPKITENSLQTYL